MSDIKSTCNKRGAMGKAWQCDLAKARQNNSIPTSEDAALAHWIVEAPWAHPIWHSYFIVLIHLRPLPDIPTYIYLKGATHELWVIAIDPKANRQEILDRAIDSNKWLLHPLNFAAQMVEENDRLAIARIEQAVQDIVDGKLNPDTDFSHQWITRFGDNMVRR